MPKHLSPVKAIKIFCYECVGSAKERILCVSIDCPLYPYRLGDNPNRKGIGGRRSSKKQKLDKKT
jgi:hypothetical protein